ncbi:MAG TPA: phosphatase PAP2 family protein [Stellaceae bacterium]|nr:phosphatase PAP2 family protein [Stellaceae bacterium]
MWQYLWTKLLWCVADFGDVAVALPIAAIVTVWLCTRRRWSTALWYAVAVLGCSAIILFLKVAFFAGELRMPALGLQNPSGHSAVSAVVYGSLAWILSGEMPARSGRTLLWLTCAGIIAVGGALYAVRAHTLADVIVGLTLGGWFAGMFAVYGCREEVAMRGSPARLMLVIALVALSLQSMTLVPRLTSAHLLLLMRSWTVPA